MSEQRLIDANEIPMQSIGSAVFAYKHEIDQMPTIPAEVVIHCGECSYYKPDDTDFGHCERKPCGKICGVVNPHDYCSMGKPKEDKLGYE
jgi:hypothetical protein